MPREDRIGSAGRVEALARLDDARAFLQQAELSLELVDGSRRYAVAVSSAVLAGIAAADAACAVSLGTTSAGQHDQVVKLLRRISGGGRASNDMSRLLASKSAAQYSGGSVTQRAAADSIARAQRLVRFAEEQLRG
jgi:hypothetical protein